MMRWFLKIKTFLNSILNRLKLKMMNKMKQNQNQSLNQNQNQNQKKIKNKSLVIKMRLQKKTVFRHKSKKLRIFNRSTCPTKLQNKFILEKI